MRLCHYPDKCLGKRRIRNEILTYGRKDLSRELYLLQIAETPCKLSSALAKTEEKSGAQGKIRKISEKF